MQHVMVSPVITVAEHSTVRDVAKVTTSAPSPWLIVPESASALSARQTAQPDTSLCEVADLREDKHIKRVPIVNTAGDLVGIVSRSNVIQAIASAHPRLEITVPDAMIRKD